MTDQISTQRFILSICPPTPNQLKLPFHSLGLVYPRIAAKGHRLTYTQESLPFTSTACYLWGTVMNSTEQLNQKASIIKHLYMKYPVQIANGLGQHSPPETFVNINHRAFKITVNFKRKFTVSLISSTFVKTL